MWTLKGRAKMGSPQVQICPSPRKLWHGSVEGCRRRMRVCKRAKGGAARKAGAQARGVTESGGMWRRRTPIKPFQRGTSPSASPTPLFPQSPTLCTRNWTPSLTVMERTKKAQTLSCPSRSCLPSGHWFGLFREWRPSGGSQTLQNPPTVFLVRQSPWTSA